MTTNNPIAAALALTGRTAADLARDLDVAYSTVHAVVSGKKGISLDRLQRWSEVLQVRFIVEPGSVRVERLST